jgi:NADH-quinone oxidoreductase subunit G
MPVIYIDNKPYEVPQGKNLLEVCLSLGYNLPYFCWHPALGSVGACRQCAVKQYKDENDPKGRLVMSCMEPVGDQKRISIQDPEAVEMRENVIEWLMTNHPHDCAICDEGGSCHLQDMTVMTGHTYRSYRYKKRTYRNQYLGSFINHEMNRCIQCYRCVRYYKDYAGGEDLDVFAAHNHVYFGRQTDGVLESEFSGNLVEVCPTGVFTDKTLKDHYTRKWDLTMAPSICHHCSLGCNITAGERYGTLRNITNRYNREVNGYFLCDRGRFGYEFVNSPKRIRKPMVPGQQEHTHEDTQPDMAVRFLGDLLKKSKRTIGIGSPRASLESNYALRTLVGADNFFSGDSVYEYYLVKAAVEILKQQDIHIPSLREVEEADAVFILGEDVTNTAPMLALAVRQAVRNQPSDAAANLRIPLWQDEAVREVVQDNSGPLYIASALRTRLDDIATSTYHHSSDDIARLGFAVANMIHSGAPGVKDLGEHESQLARQIADALMQAKKPLIISGTGSGRKTVMRAAANVSRALRLEGKQPGLYLSVPECNSMGLSMMDSGSLEEAFMSIKGDPADTLIVLENDLYREAYEKTISDFLSRFENIIVLDSHFNHTTEKANYILPSGTFAEADGTLISSEGRAQRFFQVYYPGNEIRESWKWISGLMHASDHPAAADLNSVDDFTRHLEQSMPQFKGVSVIAPGHELRFKGQKIPRRTQRYSGRTAMHAHMGVSEMMPPDDPDTVFAFSLEGYRGQTPASIIPYFWSPGWNSNHAVNKYQSEIGGPIKGGDAGKVILQNGNGAEHMFWKDIPETFHMHSSKWFVVPIHHIFGSEEMSSMSPAVAERIPEPYVVLHPSDAEKLNAQEGSSLNLNSDGTILHNLELVLKPELTPGTVGIPVGLPGLKWISVPGWVILNKTE